MKAELIAVGTELLMGQIANTNAQFLSEKLASVGIDVYFHTVVGDNAERLLSVLSIAKERSDLIILCGGLGPTDDDLTKETLAHFLNKTLVIDAQSKQRIDDFFNSRPGVKKTPNNEKQAQMIEGSIPLSNPIGLAVGNLVTSEGVTYVVLPGPPNELKPMVEQSLLSILDGDKALYSRVLRFVGIGESQLVTILDDVIKEQSDPTIAPYAKTGEVTLRLTTRAGSEKEATEKLDKLERVIFEHEKMSDYFYAYGDTTSLSEVVVNLLKERNLTISAAESLTAGLFQAEIAAVPGASAIFPGGLVTYSMEAKSKLLDIPMADLIEHGVVSGFTAKSMAEKTRQLLGTDMAISLTGVAGPADLEGNPVGTVFIGLATQEKTNVLELKLGNRDRSIIRQVACLHALNLVRKTLLNL